MIRRKSTPDPGESIPRLFRDAPIGIYKRAADGTFLTVNDSLAAMFDYDSPDAFLKDAGADLTRLYVNPDKFRESRALLESAGAIDRFLFRAFRRDGGLIWIEETARQPEDLNAGGDYYGFMEDATDRKSAEWALLEAKESYQDIFENAVEGIFRITTSDRLTTANRSMAEMLGYASSEELISLGNVSQGIFADPQTKLEMDHQLAKHGEIRFFEARVRRKDGSTIWVSINAKAILDSSGRTVMYEGSMIDVTEKRRSEELLKENLQRTRGLFLQTVSALAKTVQFRDSYTAGHQENVAELACRIAREMDLSEEAVEGLRLAGLLHDIGKINVPLRYLTKPGKLDPDEWAIMCEHPRTGFDILKNLNFPWPIAEMVLQHHERMDGSGYPAGLSGKDIMIEARIMAVADVIDAMASHRPYRPALGIGPALEEITRNRSRLYDQDAADAALRIFRKVNKA